MVVMMTEDERQAHFRRVLQELQARYPDQFVPVSLPPNLVDYSEDMKRLHEQALNKSRSVTQNLASGEPPCIVYGFDDGKWIARLYISGAQVHYAEASTAAQAVKEALMDFEEEEVIIWLTNKQGKLQRLHRLK